MVGEGPLWSLNKTPNQGTTLEETREAKAGKGSFTSITPDGGGNWWSEWSTCAIYSLKKSISLLAHALFYKSMSMEMCSRVEEMQISKYHMKGCKNEHSVDPVETGAIKKQSFNNFLTLFVMLCFTLFSILGIHLIKPQCHLAKRLH